MKTPLILFALLAATMLHAQWTQLPMPEGGDIQFLGTAHNRVWTECSARNYFSDDQGLTWKRWALQDTLDFIKMNISNDALMAVAKKRSSDFDETIFKSTDNGDTWQAIFSDTLHKYGIGYAFSAGGYLFFVDVDNSFGSHLYRSSDQGKTWDNINVDGNGTGDKQLSSVIVGNDILSAWIDIVDGIGDPTSYQVKSTDFGQTWTGFNLPYFSGANTVSVFENCWVVKGSFNPQPATIYVSFDSGTTFTQIPNDPCKSRLFFAPPNKLYAYDDDCIYLLDLALQSWQPIPVPPLRFSFFIQAENGVMLVGSHGPNGVWRKPVNTISWSAANNGLQSSGVNKLGALHDHFFLVNESGVHRSTDNCQTWMDKSPPEYAFDLQFWGDTLLATNYEKIYFSADEGNNWSTLFQTKPVYGKIRTSGDAMYCAIRVGLKQNILYTPDRGSTSSIIVPPLASVGASLLDYFVFQGRIWVVMDIGQVFYSDDAGQTWIGSVAVGDCNSFFNQGEHFFLSGEQFFYSPDGGVTWLTSLGIPAGKFITSIINDKNDLWYAAVGDLGLFVSNDFGANWTFWENPGYPKVFSLYSFGDFLFASRYPTGLWRRPVISSHTTTPQPDMVSDLMISPNPAQHELEVEWPTDTPQGSPLFVFDLTGKVVLQTINGYSSALKLDISAWPSGFYIVKVGNHLARFVKN
ncbi:MAG: T9SS type A sorting domain-containing protein [Phycisphaerae bacterium]|nr:T9SS type A sorting domain-containing protein [Saprospiraceae bacterium]